MHELYYTPIQERGNSSNDDDYERLGHDSEGIYEYWRGWNWKAAIAVVMAVLPNVPGFLVSVQVLDEDSITGWIIAIYNYAWFVALFISFFLYWALMKVFSDNTRNHVMEGDHYQMIENEQNSSRTNLIISESSNLLDFTETSKRGADSARYNYSDMEENDDVYATVDSPKGEPSNYTNSSSQQQQQQQKKTRYHFLCEGENEEISSDDEDKKHAQKYFVEYTDEEYEEMQKLVEQQEEEQQQIMNYASCEETQGDSKWRVEKHLSI